MPPAYFLFIALIVMMVASLSLYAGLRRRPRKAGALSHRHGHRDCRAIFRSRHAASDEAVSRRFAAVAFAICSYSLRASVAPTVWPRPATTRSASGHIACALILLIWFAVVPRCRFQADFCYALLAVPALALIGSGSRGPAIACAVVILVEPVLLSPAAGSMSLAWLGLGLAALPFANIPGSSLDYLGTLVGSQSVTRSVEFSRRLLDYGWKLLSSIR